MQDENDLQDVILSKNSAQLLDLVSEKLSSLKEDASAASIAIRTINEFEISPALLDAKLPSYVDTLSTMYMQEHESCVSARVRKDLGNICYNLAKVRGFKVVMNYFPTNVYLVPKLLELLDSELPSENEVFLVLIWLSSLVLVPFPFKKDMVDTFYRMGLLQLKKFSNGSKNQLCASILLSRFLSRPDSLMYLQSYLQELLEHRSVWDGSEKLGHLMVLNKLFKNCPAIDRFTSQLYHEILSYELISMGAAKENSFNVLYMIKILSKLAVKYIKHEDYDMVSQIFNNLINEILRFHNDSFETTLRYALAKSLSKLCIALAPVLNYHHQVLVYLIGQLKLDVPIDRIEDYENPPINKFVDVRVDFNSISTVSFHTVLLFFGFLALQKQLPLYLLPTIMSITHKTLFAHSSFNPSVGNQLKDSSCFILWAAIRSLDEKSFDVLERANPTLFSQTFIDVLEVTVFDQEVLIRRCGGAVFQEFLGRLANKVLKTPNDQERGEQTIRLIELVNSSTFGTIKDSVNILDKMLDLGLDKGTVIEMIVRNIRKSDDFKYQALLSKKLNELWSFQPLSALDIGLKWPFVDACPDFSGLTHELYLKSEFYFYQGSGNVQLGNQEYSEDLAEDFVRYYMCSVSRGSDVPSEFLERLIHTKKDISANLKELFETMAANQLTLTTEVFHLILSHLTVPLSKSIFYFTNLSEDQVSALLEMAHSKHVDYDVRMYLIKGFHCNFHRLRVFGNLIPGLVVLLNDYTTTEQGDVGSRIRDAVLDFVTDEFPIFKDHANVKEPLFRIAGEPIEKLRVKALRILLMYDNEDLALITEAQYYERLFAYYRNHDLSTEEKREFFRGLVLSAGGLTGSNSNIRECFKSLLEFLETNPEVRKDTLKELFYVITRKPVESQKTLKEYIPGLNVIIKLFESNFHFPTEFIKPLYVKVYNLQINCANSTRFRLTLKLMSFLALQDQDKAIKLTSLKRILSIVATHKAESVRSSALQFLYEMLLENDDDYHQRLEAIDVNDRQALEAMGTYMLSRVQGNLKA